MTDGQVLSGLDVDSPVWRDRGGTSMGRGAVRGGIAGTACAKEWNDAWVRATIIHSQQVLQQPWLNTHLASGCNGRNTKLPFQDG